MSHAFGVVKHNPAEGHSRQAKQEFQACLKYSWSFCVDY
jgi:hypothetical protein